VSLPAELIYTDTHEWCRRDGNVITMGITQHAADALTDLVCIEFNKAVGDEIEHDEEFGVVDSVKASEPLISPVNGKVIAVNSGLEDEDKLGLVNTSPYGEGWLVKIELADPAELEKLFDAAGYAKYLAEEG